MASQASSCVARWARRTVTVSASSSIVRRPWSVFGSSSNRGSWSTVTSCRRTATVPASRWTSGHVRPQTSPRTHPAHGGQPERRVQVVLGDRGEERAELRRRPPRRLGARESLADGGSGGRGGVAGHEALADRVGQGLVDIRVQVPDRTARQTSARLPVPGAGQLRVEPVEVAGREGLELHAADPGREVEADVALVRGEGRRAEGQPSAGSGATRPATRRGAAALASRGSRRAASPESCRAPPGPPLGFGIPVGSSTGVHRGEIDVSTPQARRLLRRLVGGIAALESAVREG